MRTHGLIVAVVVLEAVGAQPLLAAGGSDERGLPMPEKQTTLPAEVGAEWWRAVREDVIRSEYSLNRNDAGDHDYEYSATNRAQDSWCQASRPLAWSSGFNRSSSGLR